MSGFRGKFVAVKTAKRRKTSSKQWLARQLNDPYVSRAKIDGYRSRAAYKLLEINDKFKLLKPGMKIVDLGAAPGGWSQVVAKIIKSDQLDSNNNIVAIDLLEIKPIAGVKTLQKDFFAEDAEQIILEMLEGRKPDLVMSDMAANTIGHGATDHIRTAALCEHAVDFAIKILKPGGHFIAKIFRGGAENDLLNKVKLNFHIVKHFKPNASRKESVEVYLVALDRK
ncbi:MAG: RlmE family RNA methyltransferase [Rickettsia endosymbiont of Bryobia graminum]|nr:RlmE family RNA methyltransferase [Rickettsia endosymbiont of Bryobia graminum]